MARARHEKTFLDLLKALEEHPEWRDHLRQMLLSRELLELPQRFAEFLEVQRAILQEIEAIKAENQKIWREIAAIKEENQRIWQEIAAIKEDIRELRKENQKIWKEIAAIKEDIRELKEENQKIWKEIVAIKEENQKIWKEIAVIKQDIRELREENQKIWREIAAIKEDIRELKEENQKIWKEIAEIKEDIRELKEENRKIWQEIAAIKEDIRDLKEENQRIWKEIAAIKITLRDEVLPALQELQEWRRGEEGRRRGERYERRILRSAPMLFAGGEGGSPEHPEIQRRLQNLLGDQIARITDSVDNVFLTDLVWRKGGRVLLVEISLRVNGKDVERASRRAQVLQEAGVDALGVVVGESWVGDARELAERLGVAWYVGGEFSPELLELRRSG